MLPLLLASAIAGAAPDLVIRPSVVGAAGYRLYGPWVGGIGELAIGLRPGPRIGAVAILGLHPLGIDDRRSFSDGQAPKDTLYGFGGSIGWEFESRGGLGFGPSLQLRSERPWGLERSYDSLTFGWSWSWNDIGSPALSLDAEPRLGIGGLSPCVDDRSGCAMLGVGGSLFLTWPRGFTLGLETSIPQCSAVVLAGFAPRVRRTLGG